MKQVVKQSTTIIRGIKLSKSKVFLTGCDANTEWMLPWFIKNYKKHNTTPIIFADFGCTLSMKAQLQSFKFDHIYAVENGVGWFKKPAAMIEASKYAKEVCWLDTDIHVLGDLNGIFSYIESEKLAMCEDRGWSKRRGEKWHNSGVVAFRNVPKILKEWAILCNTTFGNAQGDQEILHEMVCETPLKRVQYISDVPNIYNWLRLDLLDNIDTSDKLAMHWTGYKGKLQIKKMMYND